LWKALKQTVQSLPLYPTHKSYVREKILPQEPLISYEQLSARLGIPTGEAMVILSELRIMAHEVPEELSSPATEPPKYMLGSMGGTFNHIHFGHLMLLATAFRTAERVIVGVTGDDFVKTLGKKHEVRAYEERLTDLTKSLREHGWFDRAQIVELRDAYGPPAHDAAVEVIIVSPSSIKTALELNSVRVDKMMQPLVIVVCPLVLAEDGKPISSTRIAAGEVTADGRLLTRPS